LLFGVAAHSFKQSAAAYPEFWKSFVPSVWANIIGVGLAAIIGIPIGFVINHFVAKAGEHRHFKQQVNEVRQLLEQVRNELTGHFQTLFQITQAFTPQAGTAKSLAIDISTLRLPDAFGTRFLAHPSVLSIKEGLLLSRVSGYYGHVAELNRLLSARIQSMQPETWDQSIARLSYSMSLERGDLEYEVQQIITRLTGRDN